MTPRLLCAVLFTLLATTTFAQQAYFDFPLPNGVVDVDEDDGTVQFTVTRTGNLSGPVTVTYSALEDTARAGIEYVAPSATLNFADQETQKTVSLTLIDDNDVDVVASRRLTLQLSFPRNGGGSIETFMGVDVNDDEPQVPIALTQGNLTFSEGDGVTNTYLTVGLNRPSDQQISVSFKSYESSPGYNGARAKLLEGVTFAPGETSKQVALEIKGTDAYEGSGNKSFLFSPNVYVGPSVQASDFNILLTEDDPQPTVSIGDVSVLEGSCDVTPIEITLTTDYPAYGIVYWSKSDDTATEADLDYGPYGTPYGIPFLNSTIAKFTLVSVQGDLQIESDEDFNVTITSATNMAVGDGSAAITIENDDEESAGFLEDHVEIEPGQHQTLTINFPAPAPKGIVHLSSSDPRVKVPATVDVPKLATSVSFDATATEAAGEVTITANLPAKLGATQLSATIDAVRESDLHFEHSRRFMFAGETLTASLAIEPARAEAATVALTSSAGVVAPESVIVPAGGTVEFPFTALTPGRGTITATYEDHTDTFTIDTAAQQVKSFAPDSASTSGGTAITLKGVGFSSGCTASFGNVAALTTLVDAQTLIAKSPAHAAGSVNVTVTCGATAVDASGEFRFASARRRRSRH